jgi:hypothetical protein
MRGLLWLLCASLGVCRSLCLGRRFARGLLKICQILDLSMGNKMYGYYAQTERSEEQAATFCPVGSNRALKISAYIIKSSMLNIHAF